MGVFDHNGSAKNNFKGIQHEELFLGKFSRHFVIKIRHYNNRSIKKTYGTRASTTCHPSSLPEKYRPHFIDDFPLWPGFSPISFSPYILFHFHGNRVWCCPFVYVVNSGRCQVMMRGCSVAPLFPPLRAILSMVRDALVLLGNKRESKCARLLL